MRKMDDLKVGVVTVPLGSSGSYCKITSNLLKILKSTVNSIFLVTGNLHTLNDPEIEVFNVSYPLKRYNFRKNLITRLLFYLVMQLKYSYYILKYHEKFDLFFVLAGYEMILPVLTLRLTGKKPVLTALAPKSRYSEHRKGFSSRFQTFAVHTLESLTMKLAYRVILESPNVSTFMNLEGYRTKLLSGALFINDSNFKKTVQISKRNNSIGFIGRLSEEKGVMNFVKAVKLIGDDNDLNFLIRGEGPLNHEISEFITKNNLTNLKVGGWIPYPQIPQHLNHLKLLVMPSYTEGLPNLMLESMGCGTPVLATSVGGVPDFIEDTLTGFLMENNSPECIAKNIKRALKSQKMEDISENAYNAVKNEFNEDNVLIKWSNLLEQL